MRTRPKVLFSVSIALFSLFLILYLSLSSSILRNYETFERKIISEDIVRVQDALNSRRDDLYTKLGDWAQWDDTYEYVQDRSEAYVDSNLQNTTFGLLKINFIAISDSAGSTIFSKYVEDDAEKKFPASLGDILKTHPYFLDKAKNSSPQQGILSIPEGTIMFASRPVKTSDGTVDSQGRLFFGYFLDEEDRKGLAALTHLDVEMHRIDEVKDLPEFRDILSGASKHTVYTPAVGEDALLISSYKIVADTLSGEPALLLSATIPREIFAYGQGGVRLFFKTMLFSGIVITLVVLGLFEFIVLRKLSRLDAAVQAVGQSGDANSRIAIEGTDELAALSHEINQMLDTLDELSKQKTKSDTQFRLIDDITSVMIWMSGPDGRATYFNKGWLEFVGGPLEASLGDGWENYLHPDDLQSIKENSLQSRAHQKPLQMEYRLRRRDGEYRWILASGRPYFHGEEFQGYIGSGIDITDRRLNEDKDRASREETERLNQLMVARELKMIELKEKIRKLEAQAK